MIEFSKELERVIFSHLKKSYLKSKIKRDFKNNELSLFNKRDYAYFSKGAKALTESFTSDRPNLKKNYFNDPVLRSGYILYFLPVNLVKTVRIIEKLPKSFFRKKRLTILDIGSGPGTSLLALMLYLSSLKKEEILKLPKIDFYLNDQNSKILQDAYGLFDEYKKALLSRGISLNIECHLVNHLNDKKIKSINGKVNLLFFSNVLNEFEDRKLQLDFFESHLKHFLNPDFGYCILIEPALKRYSRDLQSLRDEILKLDLNLSVVSPCLHQNTCPLNIANKRDWCHFYFSWKCPDFIKKVDHLIGNKKDWLSASYLILSNDEMKIYPKTHWRVISNILHTKGRKSLLLCGELGRYKVSRLDRNQSIKNKDFTYLKRGGIAKFKVEDKSYNPDGFIMIEKFDEISLMNKKDD
jgi:ribosomal protein RSM22 (predicted rRNA methylase)